MDKKTIVHIIPTFELGGVQTAILYSLEDLNKVYNYRILVIGKIDREWIKNLPPLLQSYILGSGSAGLPGGWVKGYKTLKHLKPDLVISSLWKSTALSAVFKLLNPTVLLAGFFHSSYATHFIEAFNNKVLGHIQDFSFADSIVTKEFLEKFYKIKDAHVVSFVFGFRKPPGCKYFNPSEIKIAYFGRISPAKGVDRSLEFCRLCKKDGLNFRFDIYGDGPVDIYKKKIKKFDLEREVVIRGILPLQQVTEKMQAYDFLLQLSNYEGMALAVVEAMNCGLVPIVTPVGEIARYSKDGFNAIWLNPSFDDNLTQLVDKLKEVVSKDGSYHALSVSAANTFSNHKKYSDSLIEIIDNYFIAS